MKKREQKIRVIEGVYNINSSICGIYIDLRTQHMCDPHLQF